MISIDNIELVTGRILLGSGPGALPDQEVSGRIQILDVTVYKELNKIPFATIRLSGWFGSRFRFFGSAIAVSLL
jgi:hypothetical protein